MLAVSNKLVTNSRHRPGSTSRDRNSLKILISLKIRLRSFKPSYCLGTRYSGGIHPAKMDSYLARATCAGYRAPAGACFRCAPEGLLEPFFTPGSP